MSRVLTGSNSLGTSCWSSMDLLLLQSSWRCCIASSSGGKEEQRSAECCNCSTVLHPLIGTSQ